MFVSALFSIYLIPIIKAEDIYPMKTVSFRGADIFSYIFSHLLFRDSHYNLIFWRKLEFWNQFLRRSLDYERNISQSLLQCTLQKTLVIEGIWRGNSRSFSAKKIACFYLCFYCYYNIFYWFFTLFLLISVPIYFIAFMWSWFIWSQVRSKGFDWIVVHDVTVSNNVLHQYLEHEPSSNR